MVKSYWQGMSALMLIEQYALGKLAYKQPVIWAVKTYKMLSKMNKKGFLNKLSSDDSIKLLRG